MIRSLMVILAVGGGSFYFADLGSPATFKSLVLPIVGFVGLIALALWLVMYFHRAGIRQTIDGGSASGGFGGGDGGDGGGGC